MALVVTTSDPRALLSKIKERIACRKIRTWACNTKGYFTHTPPQWRDQAWLMPVITHTSLQFLVILPRGDAKQGVAGVYQGRFAEMLQNHFGHYEIRSSNPDESELDANLEMSNRRPQTARTATSNKPHSPYKKRRTTAR